MKVKAVKGGKHPPICASFADELNGLETAGFHSFTMTPPPASSGLPQGNTERVVVADLDRVEVRSDTRESGAPLVKYIVGVLDRNKGTIKICEAPQMRFKTIVKTRSQFKPSQLGVKNTLARNLLGETFGTIKRKQAIRATERNKVKVDSLMDAEQVIKNVIDDSSALLPTQEDMKQEQDANRLIPPYNMEAASPADVYNINTIMSKAELDTIDVSHILEMQFKEDLEAELKKVQTSSWVNAKILECLMGKADPQRIRKLVYILYMMKFLTLKDYSFAKGTPLPNFVDPQITAALMEKFTVEQFNNGQIRTSFPDRMKDKLRSYILTACLILDGFRIDVGVLAQDLNLSSVKLSTYCKLLGCTVDSKSGDERVAILKTPLKFPTISKGKRS
ncbi:RNA polymerase I associated factor, A49-like protein [Chytriomyces sp. MP71]|nr:RNA polymerase I associated factor, A49-like protein [Chytriomyces sp. MP71]